MFKKILIVCINVMITASFVNGADEFFQIGNLKIKKEHPRLISKEQIELLERKARNNEGGWNWIVKYRIDPKQNLGGFEEKTLAQCSYYLVTGKREYAEDAIKRVDKIIKSEIKTNKRWYRFDSFLEVNSRLGTMVYVYDICYKLLSPDDKKIWIQYMNEAMEELWNPNNNPRKKWSGWSLNNPKDNYHYSFLTATALVGIGTYGENEKAKEYLEIMKKKLEIVKELLIKEKGGGWHEGLGYGPFALGMMVDVFEIWKVGTGENIFTQLDFPKQRVYFTIYSTQPAGKAKCPLGDLCGGGRPSSRKEVTSWAMNLEKPESEYACFWLKHVGFNPGGGITGLIRIDPELLKKERDYRKELPLAYFAPSVGWVGTRSSWDDDAVSVSFNATQYVQGHQHRDCNAFWIYKKEWLACGPESGVIGVTPHHNTMVIGGDERYKWDRGMLGGEVIAFEDKGEYTYIAGDGTNAHNAPRSKDKTIVVEKWIRQIVYIRPCYVAIFDRLSTAEPDISKVWRLYFKSKPEVKGDITVAEGKEKKAKLFCQTFLPKKHKISVDTIIFKEPAEESGTWHIDVEPEDNTKDNLYLHLLQVSDIGISSMVEAKLIEEGKRVGLEFKDKGKNYRVIFNSSGEVEGKVSLPEGEDEFTKKIDWVPPWEKK